MFADPIKNLKALGIREDMVVADLGAGAGFYTIPLALLVPRGKVYAVEVQADYVATLRNKAKEAKLDNVEVLWGDVEKLCGTKIKEEIVDAVVASNILFQIEDKGNFIGEIQRILKREGVLLLIDWSDDTSLASHRTLVPVKQAREMFENKGFNFVKDVDAGAHHYGMILKKHEKQ